jgi:hypothetical protein
MNKKKLYSIAVVCSDTTTYCCKTTAYSKREAEAFANGIACIYKDQGKEIFIINIKTVISD